MAKLKNQLVISYHKRVYHKMLKVKTQDSRSVMNKNLEYFKVLQDVKGRSKNVTCVGRKCIIKEKKMRFT